MVGTFKEYLYIPPNISQIYGKQVHVERWKVTKPVFEIKICYEEDTIWGLRFLYTNPDGGYGISSPQFGSERGCNRETVSIPRDENLTSLKVTYGDRGLTSVSFGTNKGYYGPYGKVDGKSHTYSVGNTGSFGGYVGYTTHVDGEDDAILCIGLFEKTDIPTPQH